MGCVKHKLEDWKWSIDSILSKIQDIYIIDAFSPVDQNLVLTARVFIFYHKQNK